MPFVHFSECAVNSSYAAPLYYFKRAAHGMNVLLLSMPDYFEHMPPDAIRIPNGALSSGVPRARIDHERATGGVRWHNRGSAD
jgi:hypothetical protein